MLHDEKNSPVSDVPVRFEMQTLFGKLKLGSFPTNEEGVATVKIDGKRYGAYSFTASFVGDEEYLPATATAIVDFGAKPPPALPKEGVLIAPYPTFSIMFPFLLFYGSCWLIFAYAFGWLILGKMRRSKS